METTRRDQECNLTFPLTLIQKLLLAEVTHNLTGPSISFNNDGAESMSVIDSMTMSAPTPE